jgi:MoaA/NifB/PqqE/SkfB family radical SAM enzyme
MAWRRRSANELSLTELSNAFHQLRELGASRVTFTGGEPLLRSDVIDIVNKAKSTGFEKVMLITNGLLLEERSAELVNSGLSHLLVSIDGMQDVDSVVKGVPAHFEKAVAGIRAINKLKEEQNKNLKTVILTTLLGPNAREIPQLIEMCHELKASWLFNLLECNSDLFRNIDVKKLGFSNRETVDLLFDDLGYMKQKYPSVASFCSHELDYAKGFLRGEVKGLPCVNGYQAISIGAHGEVYSGCFALPPIGNLRDKPLAQIIDTQLHRKRLTKMYRRQCPGCTNLWAENVIARHIVAHTLVCKRSRTKENY